MTFLPIVERELRVAARRKGTYWTRVGVGVAALIVAGIAALYALFNPGTHFGAIYLEIVSGIAMAYCLGAGRFLTADSLSEEKREETMGLLFLTDLKGYDVVLGKMAATSLNGLYGLLALLPVLALTLLTGGITNGEMWRVTLVLVETFVFSLSVGIMASALTREFPEAMAANFYLLLGLAGGAPALAGLLYYFHPLAWIPPTLFFPCPIYTLTLAFDVPYKQAAEEFWCSAACVFWMSLLLVGLACRIAPHSWQEKTVKRGGAKVRPSGLGAEPRPGGSLALPGKSSSARARAFRARMLDQNAYLWLAARPWWKAPLVWVVLALGMVWLLCMRKMVGWLDETVCIMVALMLNGALKFWVTLEAGQTLAEDMRSGAFELLLATPLSTRDILRGQVMALRRQFLKPLVALGVLELFIMLTLITARRADAGYYFWFWTAGIVMLAADVVALSLVAMAGALTEKNISRALLKAVSSVMMLPWALWIGVMTVCGVWRSVANSSEMDWPFQLGLWFWIGMGLDIWFAVKAGRKLRFHFREMALRRFAEPPARRSWRVGGAGWARAVRDKLWSHRGHRKWTVALASLLVMGISWEIWDSTRSHILPPELVAAGPNIGTKFQAITAGDDGVFLILPDGSLWRWGVTEGSHRARLPEPVGTNRDWATLSVGGPQRLGVRRDGTLWEWLGAGAPTRVGDESNWVQAVGNQVSKVARKRDGTLWAWGDVSAYAVSVVKPPVWLPTPPAAAHDWKAQFPIPGSRPWTSNGRNLQSSYTLGVDMDGKLWVWGTIRLQSGSPAGMVTNYYADAIQVCRQTNWDGFVAGWPQTKEGDLFTLFRAPPNPDASILEIGTAYRTHIPIQVETRRDWVALQARGNAFYGLCSNGSLFGWGGAIGTFRGFSTYHLPTQICAESDWVGFDGVFVRNQAGQLWLAGAGNSTVLQSSTTAISVTGRLIASMASSNHVFPATNPFRSGMELYEVHPDGALWFHPFAPGGDGVGMLIGPPQRADDRSDWVAVVPAQGTTFGLTKDGTVWAWGWNLGESPRLKAQSRLDALSTRVQAALRTGLPGPQPNAPRPTYEIMETPRALMRLTPGK